MNLIFIEKVWLSNVVTDTYESSSGYTLSSILHFNAAKVIEKILFLIDDKAPQKEIDNFLDRVLRKLPNYRMELNLQSKHIDYVLEYFGRKIIIVMGKIPHNGTITCL